MDGEYVDEGMGQRAGGVGMAGGWMGIRKGRTTCCEGCWVEEDGMVGGWVERGRRAVGEGEDGGWWRVAGGWRGGWQVVGEGEDSGRQVLGRKTAGGWRGDEGKDDWSWGGRGRRVKGEDGRGWRKEEGEGDDDRWWERLEGRTAGGEGGWSGDGMGGRQRADGVRDGKEDDRGRGKTAGRGRKGLWLW